MIRRCTLLRAWSSPLVVFVHVVRLGCALALSSSQKQPSAGYHLVPTPFPIHHFFRAAVGAARSLGHDVRDEIQYRVTPLERWVIFKCVSTRFDEQLDLHIHTKVDGATKVAVQYHMRVPLPFNQFFHVFFTPSWKDLFIADSDCMSPSGARP